MSTPPSVSPRARDLARTIGTMAATGRFRTLTAAFAAAGMTELLSGSAQFTVFAPSDYAFERLPTNIRSTLLNHPDRLRSLLETHLVEGDYHGRDLIPHTRLRSRAGTDLAISLDDNGETHINGVPVLTPDILATNGVIHELDGVILPEAERRGRSAVSREK